MIEDRLAIWEFNRGNREILLRVYEKYKVDLMTLATALLYDKEAAEDVVQDVFVSFIKSAKRFRLTGSLKGYLLTCVANNARNRNKARQRRKGVRLDEAEPILSDSQRPDLSAIFSEQSHQLTWALGQLSYEQREVLLLRLYSGMRFKAIARLHDESVNTIKGRYRYGINKLRSLLNSEMTK